MKKSSSKTTPSRSWLSNLLLCLNNVSEPRPSGSRLVDCSIPPREPAYPLATPTENSTSVLYWSKPESFGPKQASPLGELRYSKGRMRQLFQVLLLASSVTAAGLAQPTITGIYNAASYAAAPLDSSSKPIGNNNIAQGSIIVLFGTNLGPAALLQAPALPLTTVLPASNGTSISVSSGGKTVSAFMLYTFASQVAAILPSSAALGAATVTVTYNGQTSAPAPVNVVSTQFGIFTQNSGGTGPAVAQVYASATPTLMGLTSPAQPGQTLVLYGTGLGAISGADNSAPGAISVGTNVTVNIAGVTTPAAYAGRSPQFPGLDQINFVLPNNVATGCYIPAEITASGRPGNLFYLSIAPAGASTCTHPLGLPAAAMSRLDTPGGTISFGMFQMLRAVVLGLPAEGAGGLFETVDANATFQTFSQILLAFGGYNYPVPSGSCAVLDTVDPASGFSVPNLTALGGKELKSADFVSLSGTNGNSATILRQMDANGNDIGGYLSVFFSTLGKGTWTLSATAGKDVGAFSASTDLPENLVWTNVGNFANPPRSDLTITWTGGATNAQSLVTIIGSSVVINPTDPSKSRGKEFFCNAPASAGRFVVPASVTQQLPSSAVDSGAKEVAFGQLGIYTGGGSPFNGTLASGAKLDGGFLGFGEAQTISVNFQQ